MCALQQQYIDNRRIQTRSPAVDRTANRTGCQWSSRSSKVNDSHL